MSNQQTPVENNDPRHAACGNLAFLMSVIRCGEQLSEVEEAAIRKTMEALEASMKSNSRELDELRKRTSCERLAAMERALNIAKDYLDPLSTTRISKWGVNLSESFRDFTIKSINDALSQSPSPTPAPSTPVLLYRAKPFAFCESEREGFQILDARNFALASFFWPGHPPAKEDAAVSELKNIVESVVAFLNGDTGGIPRPRSQVASMEGTVSVPPTPPATAEKQKPGEETMGDQDYLGNAKREIAALKSSLSDMDAINVGLQRELDAANAALKAIAGTKPRETCQSCVLMNMLAVDTLSPNPQTKGTK